MRTIDFKAISMMYKIEALQEDNPFTYDQRFDLCSIMDRVENLKIASNPVKAFSTVHKYKALEKEYLDKFNSWNGNSNRLNKTLRDYEDSNIPMINEFKSKIENLKKRFNLK